MRSSTRSLMSVEPMFIFDSTLLQEPGDVFNYLATTNFHPAETTPEKRLASAILQDAVSIIRYPLKSRESHLHRRQALDWLASNAADYLFDFVNICEILNLDPDYVRRRFANATNHNTNTVAKPNKSNGSTASATKIRKLYVKRRIY